MKPAVYSHCNVCGRELIFQDELAIGMCAICGNEEEPYICPHCRRGRCQDCVGATGCDCKCHRKEGK